MKPGDAAAGRRAAIAGAAALLGLSACGDGSDEGPRPARAVETAWMAPPGLDSVRIEGRDVTLSGSATPGDRIVLTDSDGVSVAASTGSDGRFSVRLAAPGSPVLYRAEIQRGRNEARAGSWLALAPGPELTAAVLVPGDAATSLAASGLLSSVDYDGAGLLVAGTAAPGTLVRVTLGDGPAQSATVRSDGRYVARFAAAAPGPRRVTAQQAERSQSVMLNLSAPSGALAVEAVGAGVRIDWPTPGGGGQRTWIFRAPAPQE